MKRIKELTKWLLFLVVAFAVCLVSPEKTSYASGNPFLKFTTVEMGENIKVEATLENVDESTGIAGCVFTLDYDKSKIELVSAAKGSAFDEMSQGLNVVVINKGGVNTTTPGLIATFTFKPLVSLSSVEVSAVIREAYGYEGGTFVPRDLTVYSETPAPTVKPEDYADVFVASEYAAFNPDLAAAGLTTEEALFNHFYTAGMSEARQGSSEFNVYIYMLNNADLYPVFGEDYRKYYEHYIGGGKAEGRKGDVSVVFNAEDYAAYNPDVAAILTSSNALAYHFYMAGMDQGRQGSAEFNVYNYIQNYPDLEAAFGSDLRKYYEHYIGGGKASGRRADVVLNPTITPEPGPNPGVSAADYADVFVASEYAAFNPDLAAAGITTEEALFNHFYTAGMSEARQGSSEFNVYIYMLNNADLYPVFGEDYKKYYDHYVGGGKAEGRKGDVSVVFNAEDYAAYNPDVAAVLTSSNALAYHFYMAGMDQGRQGSREFNVYNYMLNYPDLRAAFGDNNLRKYYEHYIGGGKSQGRRADILFE